MLGGQRHLCAFALLACAGCVFDPPAATSILDSGQTSFDAKVDQDAGEPDTGSSIRDASPDAGALDADPLDAAPMDADPVDAAPMDADPVDADPIDADPVDADPIDAEPMDAEPMDAEPVDTGVPEDTGVMPDSGLFNGFPYLPRNFDPQGVTPGAGVNLDCNAQITAVGALTISQWCGQPLPTIINGQNGAFILAMDSFTIGVNGSLTIEGHRPIILAVFGDVSISGELRTNNNIQAAGGASSCPADGNGESGDADSSGAGGGGGGAFADNGGAGGTASGGGGTMGLAASDTSLVPLRGGCPGGPGGTDSGNDGGDGGFGGGAIQISAAGQLYADGVIAANGQGGGGGGNGSGGGGGGSGGGILLEGRDVVLTNFAWITANGGGGGEGGAGGAADPGDDGGEATSTPAAGGMGTGSGGDGGDGGAGATIAGDLGDPGTGGGGGGGGGGSAGVIRIDEMGGGCNNQSASFSPAPVGNCP